MEIDEAKDPTISEKVKDYTDTLDGNLSDTEYISIESESEGFIMDEYLPHQRDELTTNKWEEECQVGDDLPEVDDIDGIHEGGNGDSYNGYISAKVKLPDGSGNPRLGKLLNLRKVKNMESIGNFHMNQCLNTQE